MSLTCPAPTAAPIPESHPEDAGLLDELAAAADCGAALAAADLRIAFETDPCSGMRIALERPDGDRLRYLTGRELFAVLALDEHELHAWTRRPELPLPGRIAP